MKNIKKLVLLSIFILASLFTKAQTQYYVKNGDTLGVIITIQQAQKIDNDYDLLNLLKQAKVNCDSLHQSYIIVVNQLSQEIADLKIKDSLLQNVNDTQSRGIDDLKLQITKYQQEESLADEQKANDVKIISNLKKENTKLKVQKYFGFGIGSIILVLLLIKK